MTVHQRPAHRFNGKYVISVVVLAALALLVYSLYHYVSLPVVIYDEDLGGNKVCKAIVGWNRVVGYCDTYPADELKKLEWIPSLSPPQ